MPDPATRSKTFVSPASIDIAPATLPNAATAFDPGPLLAGNPAAALQLALTLHEQGHLDEAEPMYLEVLIGSPEHLPALHGLGVLHLQRGDADRALVHLDKAVELRGDLPALHRDRGEALRIAQRYPEAVRSFERAVLLAPDDTDAVFNLGHALLQSGATAAAAQCYHHCLQHDPNDVELLICLGTTLRQLGDTPSATTCYRRATEIDPSNGEAHHLLAAIEGQTVASAPREYIASLFDGYADHFDDHLTQRLQYDAPRLLRAAIDAVEPSPARRWRIADLGCGTGLCGEHFQDRASRLIGVDLSQRMLDRAAERGCYASLVKDDLKAVLRPPYGPYDLILAADVFNYVGDLKEVIDACRPASAPRGLLGFTTEHTNEPGFQIRPSGRFAHEPDYVRSIARRAFLETVRADRFLLRLDGGEEISGDLFVLRRRA